MGVQKDFNTYEDYIKKGSLGRHETFTPRYGWLKKGYDAVIQNGEIFKSDDAIEQLGVGKNMVRSIRFWCTAFKIISTVEKNTSKVEKTEFGEKLLDDVGWDPFLEDIGSIWLLHWQLFVPPLEGVSWSFAFNRSSLWGFDIQQLSRNLIIAAQKYSAFANISEKTFEKDASCLIRMYSEETSRRDSEIECPFRELGLLRRTGEKNEVLFNNSEKPSLPPLIFAAACFSYMDNYVSERQRTIPLRQLTYGNNSPGVVFRIPETSVGSYLYAVLDVLPGVSLQDIMGSFQLHLNNKPGDLYWMALKKYYEGECK